MTAVGVLPVGKNRKSGRPPTEAGDQGTKPVRVFADVAEKATELADVFGQNTAQLLDPMIRGEVEALYEEHKAELERMRAIKRQQEALQQSAREKAAKRSAGPK